MKVRPIYSACVMIETEDCKVLCDPWFYEAYDGSWAQWPRIENPIEVCGPADYVFISHVHPDHYDPRFLRQYLAAYPNAQVIIADHQPALLRRKLESRGIKPIIAMADIGDTVLFTCPNRASTGINIDSALVVSRNGLSVANLNDNPFDQWQVDCIKEECNGAPTVALLPFVGAGPWPQCYEFEDLVDQMEAAAAKKQKYLGLFKQYCEALQPQVAVPFAGQYWLHGDQLDLNFLRGMADATECKKLWPNVWVPADGGHAALDVRGGAWLPEHSRHEPYDWPTVREELDGHDGMVREINREAGFRGSRMYRYEREVQVPIERLPLLKLLQTATRRIRPEFEYRKPLHIFIRTQLPQVFWLRPWYHIMETSDPEVMNLEPRIEVTIDARYLYGMLTRLYNANSVRIGGLCTFKCVPNVYDKELDDLFGEYWDSLRV